MFNGKAKFDSLGYKKYQELSDQEFNERYNEIINLWQCFLSENDPTLKTNVDYFVHKKNLFEVIRRCDERNVYYYVFHELEDICEYKDIALYCFWINTLKPFMVINENANIYNCANEMFSLFLILTVIEGAYKEKFGDKEFKYPSNARIKDIIYDFKYCSFTREAMIAFVETLADTYGVGIEYILDNMED